MITEQQLHHLQKVLLEIEASFLTIIIRIKFEFLDSLSDPLKHTT